MKTTTGMLAGFARGRPRAPLRKAGAHAAAKAGGLPRLLLAAAALCASHAATAAPLLDEPIQPVPLTLKQDPARADIGRQLFRDVRLSGNGRVSCASCHDLSKGGGDGRDRSVGLNGGLTSVNAPTVLNAALNFKQFWNGRAESCWKPRPTTSC